ncbi:hypothetical protein LguiB_010663 [Lonicera macranthoides]
MAKALAFVVSALFFFALAHAKKESIFQVQGKVYCDTCRVQFETKVSEPISGAQVKLECKDTRTEKITLTVEGVTNESGNYTLQVKGDHELDICEVSVVKSPREDCSEAIDEKTEVVCTNNSGMHTEVRYANPLGFMKKEADSKCKEVLDQLGFLGNTE